MYNYHFKSSILGLIFCGQIDNILTPWHIEIDKKTNYVTISKRNWYLFGIDYEKHKINHVRYVRVDNNIYSSNIHIKVFSNTFSVFGFKNSDAKQIQELITLNQ